MLQQALRRTAYIICLFFIVIACVMPTQAQQTTGIARGIVKDQTGAVVSGAQVTLVNPATNFTSTVQTTDDGEFQFSDLLPGDYRITITASGFSTLNLNDVRVELNQTTDIPAQLQVGVQGETIEVSAGGAELVETTTTTLSKSFNERQVVELGQTSIGSGVNNLALIAPNVSSSGGVGVGTGGSVGGQRPRNNNFVVDGVDNNDKSVTGPQIYVSPEVVSEFSLLQNQFSAEFGRSNGGQFITVTKSGTNDFHGSAYGFIRNRFLNAIDAAQKPSIVRERNVPGTTFLPRSDYGRFGFNIGGPVIAPRSDANGKPAFVTLRDKLFFFVSYERLQTGAAASPAGASAFTSGALATIAGLPGVSQNNLGVYRQFVPVPAAANDTVSFCPVARDLESGECPVTELLLPVGGISFAAPNYSRQNNFVLNLDYNQSDKTIHRARFNYNNVFDIDNSAFLPTFFELAPNKQRLFSYSLFHTFTSNLTNETRLAYRRSVSTTPVTTAFRFPGLTDTTFPNIGLLDLGVDIGPDPNAPQFTIENNYQIVDNVTYLAGNHSLKFGGDFRKVISPQSFVQRQRGDYQYTSADLFFFDQGADFTSQRTVGASPYYGDQKILYAFVQDDYRLRPNVTLNLGLGYSYQEVPKGANLQALNAAASVPGLIEFREPREQKKNFAPKVGIAYSPNFNSGLLGSVFGSSGQSSIRVGFSLAYDYIFDNLYILALPPQANQTIDADPYVPNFLANGGIRDIPQASNPTPAELRAVTSAYIPDQEVPYSITYTASFQRQFAKNYSVEVRYLGTRGIHLLTQNRINIQPKASPELGGLPTFLTQPTQAQLDALPLTLAQINARSRYVPRFANAGFNGNAVVGFLSNGNSTYHGGSVQVLRRFENGFQASGAYTYSHLIDDTTAEVFSTVLSPRRVQDFQNLRAERADSALDRRHRFVFSSIYELPFFRTSSNSFARTILGGFSFSGTYTAESGQKATVLSGIDANLNNDAAADRTIRNPSGVRNTASTVVPLLNSAGQVVAYRATNPNAEYIQAGRGAIPNSARNTLLLPGINNFDIGIFKNFRFGETRKIQLRADFFNAFNHPQYIPGSPNDVTPVSTVGVGQVNIISTAGVTATDQGTFNRPDRVFSSNPRVIQLALRFDF